MKIRFLSGLVVGGVLLLQGCSKDKDVVKGEFQTGVLIANEGPFSSAGGDVTFYNASSSLIEQNIYKTVNGSFAGKILQSITLDGDVGYLVLNADNKIEVINDNTFSLQHTFTDAKLINPRYLSVVGGKGYVSNWGNFDDKGNLTKSYVLTFNLNTYAVADTIGTDPGVENLLYNGKYLFAANYNFGGSNTITVIDPTTDKSVKKIAVNGGPSGMVLDVNKKLWVITTGSDAQLTCINPGTLAIEKSVAIGGFPGSDLGISPDGKKLIYSNGNSVYAMAIDATEAPATALFDASDVVYNYGLGVDPKTGDIYIADALGFTSAGIVYIYSADGTFKKTIDAGIAPGYFVFR